MKSIEQYKNYLDKLENRIVSISSLVEVLKNSCENKDLIDELITLEIIHGRITELADDIIDFY